PASVPGSAAQLTEVDATTAPPPPPGSAVSPSLAGNQPSGRGAAVARMLTWLVRVMQLKVVRFGFLAAVLALLAVPLVDQGSAVWHCWRQLSATAGLLALVAEIVALVLGMMLWREVLADLGSRLSFTDTWRIMFIGQLAKYLPGSIWAVVAQAELGADYGVPRSRS